MNTDFFVSLFFMFELNLVGKYQSTVDKKDVRK